MVSFQRLSKVIFGISSVVIPGMNSVICISLPLSHGTYVPMVEWVLYTPDCPPGAYRRDVTLRKGTYDVLCCLGLFRDFDRGVYPTGTARSKQAQP